MKQKETILKLGNPLKSKSKFTKSKIGLGAARNRSPFKYHCDHLDASLFVKIA
jgi:hypothetical protein